MKKNFYIALLLLSAIILLGACSVRKNTAASRFYHALNTRYNTYYHARELFDEAVRIRQDSLYGNTGALFDTVIEKCRNAILCHSITAKPIRKTGWRKNPKQRAWYEQREYNPFLKNCWMLMGQAQYYKGDIRQAIRTFAYIIRYYPSKTRVAKEARLWRTRCYAEKQFVPEVDTGLAKFAGGVTQGIWDTHIRLFPDCSVTVNSNDTLFKATTDAPFCLLLVYLPGKMDKNRLLFTLATYNFTHFENKELDTGFEMVDSKEILVVRGFSDYNEVKNYCKELFPGGDFFNLVGQDVCRLPVSEYNYHLLKSGRYLLEKYIIFFGENYE